MIYIIPMFDCFFLNEDVYLKANVKYEIEKSNKNSIVVFSTNTIPYVFDFNNTSEQVLKVKLKCDEYYFLFPNYCFNFFCTTIKNQYEINLSNNLTISVNGQIILTENVFNLTYSHYEEKFGFVLIYFTGKRNFVVVLKDLEVKYSNYYDECNINDDEILFMCRLNDCLNHGKVCSVKNNEVSDYLVYLDDNDLNLKTEFVGFVFLDCLKAGNYNYCNNLLTEEMKLKDVTNIKSFFPEFDYFYPIKENIFILIKKNTLAGIFEFEICNNKINNITSR